MARSVETLLIEDLGRMHLELAVKQSMIERLQEQKAELEKKPEDPVEDK